MREKIISTITKNRLKTLNRIWNTISYPSLRSLIRLFLISWRHSSWPEILSSGLLTIKSRSWSLISCCFFCKEVPWMIRLVFWYWLSHFAKYAKSSPSFIVSWSIVLSQFWTVLEEIKIPSSCKCGRYTSSKSLESAFRIDQSKKIRKKFFIRFRRKPIFL